MSRWENCVSFVPVRSETARPGRRRFNETRPKKEAAVLGDFLGEFGGGGEVERGSSSLESIRTIRGGVWGGRVLGVLGALSAEKAFCTVFHQFFFFVGEGVVVAVASNAEGFMIRSGVTAEAVEKNDDVGVEVASVYLSSSSSSPESESE